MSLPPLLFNLDADPGETTDLAGAADFTFKWPLCSAKFLQNAPVFGEKVVKKRVFNVKYAVMRD